MKGIFPKARSMIYEETKAKLEKRDYFVSPNYGLILKKEDSESVIADIRFSEKKVILPYWNEKKTEGVRDLKKVLEEENIDFRNNRNEAS